MDQLSFLGDGDLPASPIRRQYLDIKRRYPDAILLFRLGDFYETFDDDARTLSSELEIVLTSRDMGRGEKVPLAGIPYHAAEGYIARLIARGYKLAVCEQLGTTPVKGLVPREVVRVITPGTLLEESLLPTRANNYLAALVEGASGAGLAYADISTGEFLVTELPRDGWRQTLVAELERLRPAECLLERAQDGTVPARELLPAGSFVTSRDPISGPYAERLLRDHFRVASMDGFGLLASSPAVRAAAMVVAYLRETQPASLKHLESLRSYGLDRFMKLDASARRHLELTANEATGGQEGSLLGVLDYTRTAMGARLLRAWVGQPLLDRSEIESRLDFVEEFVKSALGRAEVGVILGSIGDLERMASRAAQQTLGPRDCLGMARSLRSVPRLLAALQKRTPGVHSRLGASIDPCDHIVQLVGSTVSDEPAAVPGSGVIRHGRSRELDELRSITGDTRQWIAGLERQERERTGVKNLKIGFNKVFGYYIEVSRPNLDAPTDEFARMKTGASRVGEMLEALGYQRKQTIANGERFVTAKLKEQELRLQNAEAEIEALERQIYAELLAEISETATRIRGTAQTIALVDTLLSLAEAAVSGRYVRPATDSSTDIEIVAGRHPVVERVLRAGDYVPNDCVLSGDDRQIAVLTGPNMAGKSTYLLGVAMIVIMAQVGSFVPAGGARIGVADRIFTRIGAQHDISGGKSTFLVEMSETANVLNNAGPRSLVLLDEIGRGTSTYDGMAIARAVIEYLHDHPRLRCRSLFATHYHELTELETVLPRVFNLRMEVLEEGDSVTFLHQVVSGGADRSYGIHVAQLAGIPHPVVTRARQILGELEAGGAMLRPPSTARPSPREDNREDVLARLDEVDITRMTPIDALALLNELQSRLRGSG